MRTESPDPIADPAGYQQHLLGLLGGDDPAEVQTGTPASVRALLKIAGADATVPPEPTEWSVVQCLAHMTDAEIVVSGRYRWILAHVRPPLMGYDQDRWVDELHRPLESAEELLALFEPLRAANIALWHRTPDDRKDRMGIHAERGPESYDLTFRLIAGHDRFHLAQAERALGAVRGT
ncbi:MAG: DinB family protein [Actinobacteria bacterium]|nr:MAG: DinB family protein [Actinomycetota bacterium]